MRKLIIASMAAAAFSLAACSDKAQQETSEAGAAVADDVAATGDAMAEGAADAADATADAAKDAGNAVEGAVNAAGDALLAPDAPARSEEHTSELQSLMRISYAVFCLKKKRNNINERRDNQRVRIQAHKS